MLVIFCADPLSARQVDSAYQQEADALRSLSSEYRLIDFEALVASRFQQAVKQVGKYDLMQTALYRGWMLKPTAYAGLYDALLERGVRLMNTPGMYRHAHYLPENYPVLEGYTPRSVWLPVDEHFTFALVHQVLTPFGEIPLIVKDYVKSQKHYWHEACFIPNAADRAQVERVVQRFLDLQGDDLNVGLVFREFIHFAPLTQHSRSGMPLTQEFRLFMKDGKPIYSTRYWSEGEYAEIEPPIDLFSDIMSRIQSRFFTMDIAKRLEGEWMIVELGDGQVAGLPDHTDTREFFQRVLTK